MADLHDDDHLFEDVSPESPGTIGRNIVRRLGLASQVAEADMEFLGNKVFFTISRLG